MSRVILSAGALLLGVLVLAACGGSGRTSGVAGAHHTMQTARFRATVQGFDGQLQTSVKAFQSGNLARASAGRMLLTRCPSTVAKLRSEASTRAQMQAVAHLRGACSDMSKALHTGMSGNLAKAKLFSGTALKQAQMASRLSG